MKKCVFIIPYFGKMPDYFELFLKTCRYNPEFEWIIFTDDHTEYNYPNNVKKINFRFKDMQELIKKKFDFNVCIDRPYKLCDFKPAYGYIFEDYINEYKFWGHCDVDVLMGDLSKFITDIMLEEYDKLFCLGHMVLYRNTYENNRTFMLPYQDKLLFKESFSTNKITVFDETYGNKENVDSIFLEHGKKVFRKDWSLNFSILPTKFFKTTFNENIDNFVTEEKYKKAIYLWYRGKVIRMYINKNHLIKEEYMYIHLQARKMKLKLNPEKNDIFKIVPNSFLPLEVDDVTMENFDRVRKSDWNFHFIKTQYKWKKNSIKKILKYLFKK